MVLQPLELLSFVINLKEIKIYRVIVYTVQNMLIYYTSRILNYILASYVRRLNVIRMLVLVLFCGLSNIMDTCPSLDIYFIIYSLSLWLVFSFS